MADTTVKYFTSSMVGAPSLTNAPGSLLAVLDACLVTGFGLKTCDSVVISKGVGTATIGTGHAAIEQSVVLFAGATTPAALNGERKVLSVGTNIIVFDAADLPDSTVAGSVTVKLAPAGWLKAFSGTNLAAYKSANPAATGVFARFDDTTTTYASVRGYETLTDINTGSGMFPMVSQQAHSSWPKSSNSSAKNWWLIANDRCVYFGVAPSVSYPVAYLQFFIGDIISRRAVDPYRFCVMSNLKDCSNDVSITANPLVLPGTVATSSGKYLARMYSGFGSPVSITQSWYSSALSHSGGGGIPFPNASDNALILLPMYMSEGNVLRGELPGICATPQATQSMLMDGGLIKDIPGITRTFVYRTVNSGYSTVGGVFYDLTGPWSF